MSNAIIGYYILEEEEVFTKHYEVAAWYREIKVQPGDYPVYGSLRLTDLAPKMTPGKVNDTSVSCALVGEVVSSDFTTLLCGVRVGEKINTDVGEKDTYHVNSYSHAIASNIIEGKATRFVLAPEFHARRTPFVYDGEVKYSTGIFHKESDIVFQVQQNLEESIIALYAYNPENKNSFSVMAYSKGKYLVGTFEQGKKQFVLVAEYEIPTDKKNFDVFTEARSKYFSLQ